MDYRKWIYRRLPLGLVGVGVLLASAVWVVSCQADRRIEERLETIRAAGEPVSLADVTPPSVPDEENAAVPLTAAFRILEQVQAAEDEAMFEDDDTSLEDDEWYGPHAVDTLLEDPWCEEKGAAKAAREWAARRDGVRPWVDSAFTRSRCRFDAAWAPITDPEQLLAGHIEGITELMQWIAVRAALSARGGDGGAAYAALDEAMRLASLAIRDGSVIFWLVRMVQERNTLMLLEAALARVPMTPARRAALGATLRGLDGPGGLAKALVRERAFALDAFGRLDELAEIDGIKALVPGLVFRLDRARYLELAARGIELARRPYAETRDAWGALKREVKNRSWYQVLSGMFMSIQPMAAERSADHLARVRLARFALSIEATRRVDGTLLSGLDADVAWVDPCDGRPLRCRPSEDGGYLLWSVGNDGKDDGGWDEESDEACESDVVWRVAGRVPAPAR